MLNNAGLDAKPPERARQVLEQTLDAARAPAHLEGSRWAVLVSLLALILSGFSLYETVLKQGRPLLHLGAVMYYARDPDGAEVFALPITITNHGARDTVVTHLDLGVAAAKPDAGTVPFTSTYVAAGNNPPKDKQPFTPLSIPGRGSYAGIILFYPKDLRSRSPHVVASGEQTYRFCVGAHTTASPDYPLLDALLGASSFATTFEAELPWFAARALDSSQPIALQIKNAKRHDVPPTARGTVQSCD